MMFVENLLNGVATSLGYLLVFGLLSVVMWKLGPRLYGKLLNQMLERIIPKPAPSPKEEFNERCENCGVPSDKIYLCCPWCGSRRKVDRWQVGS